VDYYSGTIAPSFTLIGSDPRPGQLEVYRNTLITLFFSTNPRVDSVNTVNVRLFSGLIEVAGRLKVDLLQHSIQFTPISDLRPNLRYQIYLKSDLDSVNGAKLDRSLILSFTTGSNRREGDLQPRGTIKSGDMQPLWDKYCTGKCHNAQSPKAGLDRSSPIAAIRTLKEIPSMEWEGMLRVYPGDHARSYLMRKVIGEEELMGFSMPPELPKLSLQELRQIANWIDDGAQ